MIILNEDQQKIHDEALRWYYSERSQVFEIDGLAGTGKSILISQILNSLGLKSENVLAMAYTGAASLVMKKRGFPQAQTIHSALYELIEVQDFDNIDSRYGIPKKKLIFSLRKFIDANIKIFFIDEGYMVPKYMVKDILSFGIRVIVAGDQHQLPPVGDEPGFLVNDGVHHLTQLMRQSINNPIVYLAMRAINGLPIHNGLYGNNVMVINDNELLPYMIGYSDVILCGTNKTRDIMNSQVRRMAGINSILPLVGERVICRQNNWSIHNDEGIFLVNGLTGTITNQYNCIDNNNKDKFRIDFIPDCCYSPFNGLLANYEYFTANYEQKKIMKDHKTNYNRGELFEFAYALSVHLSQGNEYEKGIYIEEFLKPQIQNQLNYTAITRFKSSMIYIHKTHKKVF